MNPLTPVSGGEAGGAGLAALWQQVAAATAQPMAGGESGQGLSLPTGAAAAAGPAAPAVPAATASPAADATATAAVLAAPSPAVSLRDRLSPAPHASAAALPRAEAHDGPNVGAQAQAPLAAPSSAASAPVPATAAPLQAPVVVSTLFTLPPDLPRRQPLPQDEAAAPRRRGGHRPPTDPADDGPADEGDNPRAPKALVPPPDPDDGFPQGDAVGDMPASGGVPTLAACRALLARAGREEAVRELALQRYVLLVCAPPAAGPAEAVDLAAWLIGGPRNGVATFPARWWPPAGLGLPAQWRLHRQDGAAEGLRSRSAAPGGAATPAAGCRLLLGTWPRLADPGCALLGLSQPRRFGRSLGAQWSLLLVVLPTDLAA
ncbi:hypothetical protein [Aquincola sp. J276]|uniref:hypothetical protein n=1 Tax=Aquincola sp. J276 TaxID=2898432 RepID=UPI0021511673|nr:hypothetical protein [Aquincola sp. J276]MCR5867127.1 hypothetical protein [Aquincola sp. J276]